MRSKKTKTLCCLVNPFGECLQCKKSRCGTHAFECIDCGIVCLNCVLKYACTTCSEEVCDGCAHKDEEYIRCGDCYSNTNDYDCPCCSYDYDTYNDPPGT